LDTALHDGSAFVWLFISIGLDTGRRHGEILGARLEHFDAVRRRLNVLVKGGSWPKQPLTRGVVSILVRDWSSPIELVHRQRFRTCAHAKAAIFEYIEVFYNRQRRHSGIGYQTPNTGI